ncbi:unnamed protein product [Chrysoparadoxa australica]
MGKRLLTLTCSTLALLSRPTKSFTPLYGRPSLWSGNAAIRGSSSAILYSADAGDASQLDEFKGNVTRDADWIASEAAKLAGSTLEVLDAEDESEDLKRDEFLRSVNFSDQRVSNVTAWSLDDVVEEEQELSAENLPASELAELQKLTTVSLTEEEAWIFDEDTDLHMGPIRLDAEESPLSQAFDYWDSIPDPAQTKRIYLNNYKDRVAALKYTIDMTTIPGYASCSELLQGVVTIQDWLWQSGRLGRARGIAVDANSWWGLVSYALSIPPLLAVEDIRQGHDPVIVMPNLERVGGKGVRAWKRVWNIRNEELASRIMCNLPIHGVQEQNLLAVYWAAIFASIDEATSGHAGQRLFAELSPDEQEFAAGWLRHLSMLRDARAGVMADFRLLEDPQYLQRLGRHRSSQLGKWWWSKVCGTYHRRKLVPGALADALLRGRWHARAKLALIGLLPPINYRLFTFPLGVDPAEQVIADPRYEGSDPISWSFLLRNQEPIKHPFKVGSTPLPMANALRGLR